MQAETRRRSDTTLLRYARSASMRRASTLWPWVAVIACICSSALVAVPAFGYKPKPHLAPAKLTGDAYSGAPGAKAASTLTEIQLQFDHYSTQARQYELATLVLRCLVAVLGFASAVVLALSKAEWSRKTALVLSILIGSVPATDQIFQISEMRQVSWKTAVDLSRLYSQCRDTWELYASNVPLDDRLPVAERIFDGCRDSLAETVNSEMGVSLQPLVVTVPAEARQ